MKLDDKTAIEIGTQFLINLNWREQCQKANGSPTQTFNLIPIAVTANPTTLNAIATEAGFLNSGMASSTYSGSSPVCGDPTQNGPNFSATYNVPPTTLPLSIGFTSPTSGCGMHMTLDGSAPTCSSAAYAGQNILATTIMRVIACQGGYGDSGVLGGTWTIINSTIPPIPPRNLVITISQIDPIDYLTEGLK